VFFNFFFLKCLRQFDSHLYVFPTRAGRTCGDGDVQVMQQFSCGVDVLSDNQALNMYQVKHSTLDH